MKKPETFGALLANMFSATVVLAVCIIVLAGAIRAAIWILQ